MELILIGIDIILKEDLNIVIHLRIDVLTEEAANDSNTLSIISPNSSPYRFQRRENTPQSSKKTTSQSSTHEHNST